MDKLNLLILGEQKCGTHSLKMCLKQHSKIDMIVKELHIFDNPPQRALKKANIVIDERIERKKENQSLKIGVKYLGEGRWQLTDFKKAFSSKKRTMCAPPAPAHGLYLHKVKY